METLYCRVYKYIHVLTNPDTHNVVLASSIHIHVQSCIEILQSRAYTICIQVCTHSFILDFHGLLCVWSMISASNSSSKRSPMEPWIHTGCFMSLTESKGREHRVLHLHMNTSMCTASHTKNVLQCTGLYSQKAFAVRNNRKIREYMHITCKSTMYM